MFARTPRSLARPIAVAAPIAGANTLACLCVEQRIDHALSPFSQRGHVEPAGERRQQSDIGEPREAATDIGIVVEDGNREMLGKAPVSRSTCPSREAR